MAENKLENLEKFAVNLRQGRGDPKGAPDPEQKDQEQPYTGG